MAPAPLAKAYFVNSGSEAIDTAIKLIWYYQNARGLPEKKKLIARQRAYHGITIAAGHLTGSLAYTTGGFDLPMMDRFRHVTAPNLYRYGLPGETEAQFVERLAKELEDLILAEGPETMAALLRRAGAGCRRRARAAAQAISERVQEILKQHDILFVADEVICGFGRTGNMLGLRHLRHPARPADLRQAALLGLPADRGPADERRVLPGARRPEREAGHAGHGLHLWRPPGGGRRGAGDAQDLRGGRHLRACARGRAALPAPLKRLEAHPLVGEARGVGLIGGIEIVRNKATREQFDPALKANAQVVAKCQAHGLMLRPLPGDSIGICPPMIITGQEIDLLFDRLQAALDDSLGAMPMAA